jgi:hypothetical protein
MVGLARGSCLADTTPVMNRNPCKALIEIALIKLIIPVISCSLISFGQAIEPVYIQTKSMQNFITDEFNYLIHIPCSHK